MTLVVIGDRKHKIGDVHGKGDYSLTAGRLLTNNCVLNINKSSHLQVNKSINYQAINQYQYNFIANKLDSFKIVNGFMSFASNQKKL